MPLPSGRRASVNISSAINLQVLESQVLSLESEVKLGRENQAQSLQALERLVGEGGRE